MKALVIPFLFLGLFASGQCVYCTDLEEALLSPAKVEYLDLRAQGLTEVPEQLNDFTSLKVLDLSENLLTDLHFSEWDLPFLEELNLNFNPGVNFIEIEGIEKALPALSVLRLQRCSIFTISPEIGKLSHLSFLDVSSNSLTGLPDQLAELKELKQLYVANNQLINGAWASGLWQITELDVSGNAKINLENLGYALLFKDNLKLLKITPDVNSGTLPKIYSKVPCKELVISATNFGVVNKSLIGNPNLKNLVFEGGAISDPDRFYNWLNQFRNMDQIEFREMDIPGNFSDIESAKVILMDACNILKPTEIEKVKKTVTLEMINMNGETVVTAQEPSKEGMNISASISEAMANNKLPAIIEPVGITQVIDSRVQQNLEMDNSSFSIPSNAFLNKDGSVYVGAVKIEVKEYYDPFVNALTGAPMVYRGENGESEVFSSSGMIDFQASDSDGNALQPNPNNVIQVELRDLQPAADPNLYVYDSIENNWREIGQPESSGMGDLRQRILDSLNTLPDELFYTPNIIKPGFRMSYKHSRKDPYLLTFFESTDGYVIGVDKKYEDKITAKHRDQKWIARGKKEWRIDTVMTEELQELFKEMRKSDAVAKRYVKNRKLQRRFLSVPPILTDLKLVPNFEADNYTLYFTFKGEEIRLPVTSSYTGSIRSVQRKEKSRFLAYNKKLKDADRERRIVEKNTKKLIEEAAAEARERQADFMSSPAYQAMKKQRQETLRFGLTEFGTLNCDYFLRNKPNSYVKSTSETEDENGNKVKVPDDIRQIFVKDNAYISSPSSRIPQYRNRKNFLVFVISATQIAVIKGWEVLSNGFSKPIIKVVDTEGKTPDEVREIIMGA